MEALVDKAWYVAVCLCLWVLPLLSMCFHFIERYLETQLQLFILEKKENYF